LAGEYPLAVKFGVFLEILNTLTQFVETATPKKRILYVKPRRLRQQTQKSAEPFGLWTVRSNTSKKQQEAQLSQ
jgi:hypothetical protein